MKILDIKDLRLKGVQVIKFQRFLDDRGYFTETFNRKSFNPIKLKNFDIQQANESFSKKNTIRGLHFQWNPYMGKLVRTIMGRMVDIVLDIRLDSKTFGEAILYDLTFDQNNDYSEWIWVPPGFAHGNFFTEDTVIEYFCTGVYNKNCEAGISPLSEDISWNLTDINLYEEFKRLTTSNNYISQKDIDGYSLSQWKINKNAFNFLNKT